MKRINIPVKLYDEIKDFCSLNNIKNVNKEISYMLEKGFNLTKYGNSPFKTNDFKLTITPREEEVVTTITNNEPIKEKEIEQIEEIVIEKPKKTEKKRGITIIKN